MRVGRRETGESRRENETYKLGVELDMAHCKRLRRLVKDLERTPDEIVSQALDLYWIALLNTKGLDNGVRNAGSRRGFTRQSSDETAIAKCVAAGRDRLRALPEQ